jgi:hypothetical protein
LGSSKAPKSGLPRKTGKAPKNGIQGEAAVAKRRGRPPKRRFEENDQSYSASYQESMHSDFTVQEDEDESSSYRENSMSGYSSIDARKLIPTKRSRPPLGGTSKAPAHLGKRIGRPPK